MVPGQRFGRLTVIQETEPRRGYRYAEVRCDCGTVTAVQTDKLRTGHTSSCGCLHREQICGRLPSMWAASQTHGLTRHPLYGTWCGMIHRCEDPRHQAYHNYGGRGITVCAAWRDPAVFIAWIEANLGPRPEGMTLDRIGNDGPYAPGNVRWATKAQQRANSRQGNQILRRAT